MSESEGPMGWYLHFQSDEYISGTYGPLNVTAFGARAKAQEIAIQRRKCIEEKHSNARNFVLMWREPVAAE